MPEEKGKRQEARGLWHRNPVFAFAVVLGLLGALLVLLGAVSAGVGAAAAAIPIGFMQVVVLVLYLLPGIVAWERGHQSRGAVLVLNIFLGWTFIGWVLALVWAMVHQDKPGTK